MLCSVDVSDSELIQLGRDSKGMSADITKHQHFNLLRNQYDCVKERGSYGGWTESERKGGKWNRGGDGGRGVLQKGEGDKVNCVPNHCQTVGIRPGNLPINLN